MTRAAVGGKPDAALAFVLIAAFVMVAAVQPVPALAEGHNEAEPVAAAPRAAVIGGSGGVAVEVERGEGGLRVEARCRVDASPETVWGVLTDYDGISRFVSSMRESRITTHGDGFLLVEQVAAGRLLLFSRRMHATLRVVEEPQTRIRFEDVQRSDFEAYQGEWRIETSGNMTEIVYRVKARPTFSIPDFIARGMFKRTARDLLAQVAGEIARREAVARTHSEHGQAAETSAPLDASTAVAP